MTIDINTQDPRDVKAVQIAAQAGQWLKCRNRFGIKVYGIRSSRDQDRVHFTNAQSCTCEDHDRHPNTACKHMRAVRLHLALVKIANDNKKCEDIFARFEGN